MNFEDAIEAAESARRLIRETEELCRHFREKYDSNPRRLHDLAGLTRLLASLLVDARSINTRLANFPAEIAQASALVNETTPVLELTMNICLRIAEEAAATAIPAAANTSAANVVRTESFSSLYIYASLPESDVSPQDAFDHWYTPKKYSEFENQPPVNYCFLRSEDVIDALYSAALERKKAGRIDEGPLPGCRWVMNGKEIPDSMGNKPWQLVNHLWAAPGQSCTLTAVVNKFVESGDDIKNTVGSWRKRANTFFRHHGILWAVTVKSDTVSLVRKADGGKANRS